MRSTCFWAAAWLQVTMREAEGAAAVAVRPLLPLDLAAPAPDPSGAALAGTGWLTAAFMTAVHCPLLMAVLLPEARDILLAAAVVLVTGAL